jgi:hypothetical protein
LAAHIFVFVFENVKENTDHRKEYPRTGGCPKHQQGSPSSAGAVFADLVIPLLTQIHSALAGHITTTFTSISWDKNHSREKWDTRLCFRSR